MKTFQLNELSESDIDELCRRPAADYPAVIRQIEPILAAVRQEGDEAVRRYTRTFDGVDPDPIVIDPKTRTSSLEKSEKEALDRAIENVAFFHKEQVRGTLRVETTPGVVCMRQIRPLESVGLYIPGGSAPLPSTAIMLGVPAAIAGCESIFMATPPDRNGEIPETILYVAQQVGASGILVAGGAQAIAAMAYGTQSVPKADKLFGPGNQYVTAAKMALQNSSAMVSIDLPAGPSELLVIAGPSADPAFVAADLLSQAEHGPDSQVVVVALEGFDLDGLQSALRQQADALPRSEVAASALNSSFALKVDSAEEAIAFSNRYAPEHLILNLEQAGELTESVRHAGSVFIGPWTPESLGDYASGTNHTLPTYGYARMYSGVSLESFQKSITFQEATTEGLHNLGPVVQRLAAMEGLDAHGRAVSIRLKKLNEQKK